MPSAYSFAAFVITQVVIDCETLYFIVKGVYPIHRTAHTLVGATLVGISVALFMIAARSVLQSIASIRQSQALLGTGRISQAEFSVLGTLCGGIIGGMSHSLLDAAMHPDVQPFAPWAQSNPLLDYVGLTALHLGCVVCGVVGAFLASYKIHKENEAG